VSQAAHGCKLLVDSVGRQTARFQGHAVAHDHDAIEGEARLRAIPRDELVDGVLVNAARAGRREAVEHRRLGMVEVWQPERFATIIRIDSVFAHKRRPPVPQLFGLRGTAPRCNHRIGDILSVQEGMVEINEEKVDEMALALLYLTTFKDKSGLRAWKTYSWDVLDRLHQSGYIDDPVTKAKSVLLTEEGVVRSKLLFEKHFAK
jgi:Domain of unknown function (DUF6429)